MFEDPNAQGEADDVYNGILGEIGLEYNAQGATVPSTKIVQQQEEVNIPKGPTFIHESCWMKTH